MYNGGCGEVVNTADCGSVIRGFESLQSPHKFHINITVRSDTQAAEEDGLLNR